MLRDVAETLKPHLDRITGSDWQINFPGISEPREVWLQQGDANIGLFQEDASVKIVIWVGNSMRWRIVTDLAAVAPLEPWLRKQLAAQEAARLAEGAETARRALLPLPDVDEILDLLWRGKRIATGGGRYNETYYWEEDHLRREVFDEGHTLIEETNREELAEQIRVNPDPFRAALS